MKRESVPSPWSEPPLAMSIADIRAAIRQELEATPEYYDFPVVRSEREGDVWRVTLRGGHANTENGHVNVVLDDSFDAARAWWANPDKGGGDVLTVIPEDDQLVLKGVTAPPPGEGQRIRLYPPRYLTALASCWGDHDWATRSYDSLRDMQSPGQVEANPLSGHAFRWLRRAQRRALKLVDYTSSFLWGPPGTGKTTTLGVILAEYLVANPRSRILLLSTTNHAVDQATVAIDKALEHAKREKLRHTIKRVGSNFVASQYAGREHLLPVLDRDLIRQLAKAESERPPTTDIARYSAWDTRVTELRRRVREQSLAVLRSSRIASMTTTRAAFALEDIRLLPRYDLVVFDEASQVGLAHALAMMPLGRVRLFAGDPKQLSPVVRSEARDAQRWLARSPFAEMPKRGASVCMLDEQSRMAAPICDLVSQVFYGGELRVAGDAEADAGWRAERTREFGTLAADEHVRLLEVEKDGVWSQQFRGPIRYDSAELIASLVADGLHRRHASASEVIVLTPFRAQRSLIRNRLRERGVKGVKVSTVHRAQGSESPIVFFDPADGASPFLATEEAKRLINVALSRAQAKIVILLSPADRENPILGRLWHRDRLGGLDADVRDIRDLIAAPGFPQSAVGLRVAIGRHVGEVSGVSRDGTQIFFRNRETGAEQIFDVATIRLKFGESKDN